MLIEKKTKREEFIILSSSSSSDEELGGVGFQSVLEVTQHEDGKQSSGHQWSSLQP